MFRMMCCTVPRLWLHACRKSLAHLLAICLLHCFHLLPWLYVVASLPKAGQRPRPQPVVHPWHRTRGDAMAYWLVRSTRSDLRGSIDKAQYKCYLLVSCLKDIVQPLHWAARRRRPKRGSLRSSGCRPFLCCVKKTLTSQPRAGRLSCRWLHDFNDIAYAASGEVQTAINMVSLTPASASHNQSRPSCRAMHMATVFMNELT